MLTPGFAFTGFGLFAKLLFTTGGSKGEHSTFNKVFLGGSPKVKTVSIDGAYHQLITNEFRIP